MTGSSIGRAIFSAVRAGSAIAKARSAAARARLAFRGATARDRRAVSAVGRVALLQGLGGVD